MPCRRFTIDTGHQALHQLLSGLIDYAGLFPPAALPMGPAVEEFARQRGGSDRWALARFVVPANRLDEFSREATDLLSPKTLDAPWQLSVLAAGDLEAASAAIASFDCQHAGRVVVDAIETRADSVDDIDRALAAFTGLEVFFEIPHQADPAALLRAIAERSEQGARGKIRTGGITQETIATTADVARFVFAAARHRAPFKATAGLHHPLRGEYPLTYEADAALGTMHGFLNLFLATAWAANGELDESGIAELLEERSVTAFEFEPEHIRWRGRQLSVSELSRARRELGLSYGSCSFREPLEDLRTLGVLPAAAPV